MLAHASGEWIASDSPVCPIAETANPQRMGAALTYARRYALFTLVGIAGEDEVDAPDLCDDPRSPTPSADERSLKPRDGQPRVQPRKPGNGQRRHSMYGERLEPEQSAALRENLLTALGNISDQMATPSERQMPGQSIGSPVAPRDPTGGDLADHAALRSAVTLISTTQDVHIRALTAPIMSWCVRAPPAD